MVYKIRAAFEFSNKYASRELVSIIFVSVFCGIVGAFEIVIWQRLVDAICICLKFPTSRELYYYMFGYMIFALLDFCLKRFLLHARWLYFTKIKNKIQLDILDKTNRVDYAEFYDAKVYDEISHINEQGATGLSNIIEFSIVLIQHFITYVSVITILLPYNKWIGVLETFFIIPILIIDYKFAKKMYRIDVENVENNRMLTKLSQLMFDYRNIQEIRVFQIGGFIRNRLEQYQTKIFNRERTARNKQIAVELIINSAYIVVIYVLKSIAIVVLINDHRTIGVITMFITAVDRLALALQNVVYAYAEMVKDMLYLDEFIDFRNKPEQRYEKWNLEVPVESISFLDVYFRYPNSPCYILNGATFELKRGKHYVITGENGIGKSTIVKLITGLLKPDKGEILVNGRNIQEISMKSWYDKLSILQQEYNKYPLSVRENIVLNRPFFSEEFDKVLRMANLYDFISSLPCKEEEILDNEQSAGIDVSLGQWQKISYARAMYDVKEVLIMDEPTASLDIETKNKVYTEVRNHEGIVILISHDETETDRFGVELKLQNGTVLESKFH